MGQDLGEKHVEAYRSQQANILMTRENDPEAPIIRSAPILYNVKSEFLQSQYIAKDLLEALKIMKYGDCVNCIDDIGYDPFFVQYSTNASLQTYKKLCAKPGKTCVSIDSTAGVVKRLDVKRIFLHAVALGVPEGQFSITHMLSEVSHTQAICNWLMMWRRLRAPVPDACTTDWSRAL
ncbi:unnamed protein product [Phaedon cochleariae]|uniref:Uncharacterized protein n=1 Tax=Phaedon cochleariae TaxID=80249 RepID=A0A9N9X490_PHACE|nr:unnamed protein product [Phaedon cochleariae]